MQTNTPAILNNITSLLRPIYSWYLIPQNGMVGNVYLSFNQVFLLYCDHRIGGMGLTWSLLLFPSVIAYFITNIYNKTKLEKLELFVFIVVIVSFLITPSSWWARYSGFIVIAGIISFLHIAELLYNKFKKSFIFVVSITIMLTILQGTYFDYLQYKDRNYFVQLTYELNNFINKDKPLKIITFANLKEENYLLIRGFKSQNIVHSYFPTEEYLSPKMKNYGINNFDKISQILEKEKKVDYILVYDQQNYFVNNPNFEHVLSCYLGELYKPRQ